MTTLEIALLVVAVLVLVTFVSGRPSPAQRIRRRDGVRGGGRRENRDLL
jgi:hypothetical protein